MEVITPFARIRTLLTVREMPRRWKSGSVFFLNGPGGRARHRPLDYRQSCSQIAPFVGLTHPQAEHILRSLSGRGCETLSREPRAAKRTSSYATLPASPAENVRRNRVPVRPESFPSGKTHGEL